MMAYREMRRVIVESPYAGEVERNVAYARAAVADCVRRGEAPIASHLLFTQPGILDDAKPEERQRGIDAGHAWLSVADAVVFYVDLGWSGGMKAARDRCDAAGLHVEIRHIPFEWGAPRESPSVLAEAEKLVNGSRARSYGDAREDYEETAALWTVLGRRSGMFDRREVSAGDAARFMCALKLCRDAHRPKRDNRVDLAGYAEVLNRAEPT